MEIKKIKKKIKNKIESMVHSSDNYSIYVDMNLE